MEMIEIPKVIFYYMIVLIITFGGWYIYTAWLFKKGKMDKATTKKWKTICKLEFRHPIDQEKLIIKEYIDKYTKEHHIDWKEHI